MSVVQRFEFATATKILFGRGVTSDLPKLLQSAGAQKAFVVIGKASRYGDILNSLPGMYSIRSIAIDIISSLNRNVTGHVIFEVHGEPTVSVATEGVRVAASSGCDAVIGIGGGSVIDVGKVIAALVTNGGEPLDYMEVVGRGHVVSKPSLPFFAVPTTAGTGAEVTKNSVLASPEHRVKASIRSPFMLPRVAVVDPLLTISVPPSVTASTGLDAFTQVQIRHDV